MTRFRARLVLRSINGKAIFENEDAIGRDVNLNITTFPVTCTEIHSFAAF